MRNILPMLAAAGMLFLWPSPAVHALVGDEYIADTEEPTVVAKDEYSFKMSLRVPQVVNNSTSKGKRVYKRQKIYGVMYVEYMADGSYEISFGELHNKNFKVAGQSVRYNTIVMGNDLIPGCFNYVGNNATGMFKQSTLCFSVQMEPSYAIGVPDNDNSIYVTCAARGSTKLHNGVRIPLRFSGMAAGTQGCSCSAYGHISPTRAASLRGPTDKVEDAAATFGKWTAKWQRRVTVK